MIWATGFGVDHSWIHLPVTNEDGSILHRRGVTDTPGLYFLGLPWQHTRGSALLGWVKDDAAYLADRIAGAGAPARSTSGSSVSGSSCPNLLRVRPAQDNLVRKET